MQVYLVGGAVRDQLLGLPVHERDWVVVGATPAQLLAANFRQVGRDFPVFLHPVTHEEYALARTERKVKAGYHGFICHTAIDVTLEEDLLRRDLTINAMAQAADGTIIDPYGGQQDLHARILRHVSPAFAEDPVRILRLARFAARFPDFHIAPTTKQLIQQMLLQGEVDALVAERVWQELERGLAEKMPLRFFTTLAECQLLAKLFPELVSNFSLIATHLTRATQQTTIVAIRLAAMLLPLRLLEIQQFVSRYKLPKNYQQLAKLAAQIQQQLQQLTTAKNPPDNICNTPTELITILEQADAYRRPARFLEALVSLQCSSTINSASLKQLEQLYECTKNVQLTHEIITSVAADQLKNTLHQLRIQTVIDNW